MDTTPKPQLTTRGACPWGLTDELTSRTLEVLKAWGYPDPLGKPSFDDPTALESIKAFALNRIGLNPDALVSALAAFSYQGRMRKNDSSSLSAACLWLITGICAAEGTVSSRLSLFTQKLLEDHYEAQTGSVRRSQYIETDEVMLASIKRVVSSFSIMPPRASVTPSLTPTRRDRREINEELVRERALKNMEKNGMVEQYDVDLIMYLMYRIRSMGDDDTQRTRNNDIMVQFLRILLLMYKGQLERTMTISMNGEAVDMGQLARMVTEGKDRREILSQDVSQLEKQSKDVRARMAELEDDETELDRSCGQLESDIQKARQERDNLSRSKPSLEEAITTSDNLRKQLQDLEETIKGTQDSSCRISRALDALGRELQEIRKTLKPEWESCSKSIQTIHDARLGSKLPLPPSLASAKFSLADPLSTEAMAEWFTCSSKDNLVCELEDFLRRVHEESEKRQKSNKTSIQNHLAAVAPMKEAVVQQEAQLVATKLAIRERKSAIDELNKESDHTTRDLMVVQDKWEQDTRNNQKKVKQLESTLCEFESKSATNIQQLSARYEELLASVGNRLHDLAERYEIWTNREKPALDNMLDQRVNSICDAIQSQHTQTITGPENTSDACKEMDRSSLPISSSPLTDEEVNESLSEEEFKDILNENQVSKQNVAPPAAKDGLMKFLVTTISKLTDRKF